MKNWKHIKTIVDGEQYAINGLVIWDHAWINTGERINIQDPLYQQDYSFTVYRIEQAGITAEFAAGEFSNGVWGIYEQEN